MRKIVSLLGGILLTISELLAQPGNNNLSGTVTDSAGHKPLAGVSVFLNSTSRGTVTRSDGSFLLTAIPSGKYELILSAIGYETVLIMIDGSDLPPALKVTLHQKITELTAVTIEPVVKDGWQRYGKYFLDNFIGTTENAGSCSIKNSEVLRFHFYKKSNRLTVTAGEPLIIENSALGYTLRYQLETFSSDFNAGYVIYLGYPFFQEMTGGKGRRRRWEAQRQLAYMGSVMHFMRSLYDNHLPEEGFTVAQDLKVPNREKQRVKSIYNPSLPTNQDRVPDTVRHFLSVLNQPDSLTQKVRVTADSLLTVYADQARILFFTGNCNVLYGNPKAGIAYRQSGMQLIDTARIQVEADGGYYPPQELLVSGAWGRSEKVANLLPKDYAVPPLLLPLPSVPLPKGIPIH